MTTDPQPILELSAVRKQFGGLIAVDALDLSVGVGEIFENPSGGPVRHDGRAYTTGEGRGTKKCRVLSAECRESPEC